MFAKTIAAAVLTFSAASSGHAQPLIPNDQVFYPSPIIGVNSGPGAPTTLDPSNAFIFLQQFTVQAPGSGTFVTSNFVRVSDLLGSTALQQRIDTAIAQVQQAQGAAISAQAAALLAQRGVAASTAMANISMPSAPGRTTWAINGAAFNNEIGGGVSFAHRLPVAIPIALTAAYGNGGGTAHVGRVGLMGEF